MVEAPQTDGVKAYIVVSPLFMRNHGRLMEHIVSVARENQAQVILPLGYFDYIHDGDHRRREFPKEKLVKWYKQSTENDLFSVLDRLRFLFLKSGELPHGQPVVRLQQKHEGVYDNDDIGPFLDTNDASSLAFLMYANEHYSKKLIFLTTATFNRFCGSHLGESYKQHLLAKYGIELCNTTKTCSPFYIRDIIVGKHRQYSLPWPCLIGSCGNRLDYTLEWLVWFLAYDLSNGESAIGDHRLKIYYIPGIPRYMSPMLGQREKFQELLGESLYDEFTDVGPRPLPIKARVLSILCGNDERYQDLIREAETSSYKDYYRFRAASIEELWSPTSFEEFIGKPKAKVSSLELSSPIAKLSLEADDPELGWL